MRIEVVRGDIANHQGPIALGSAVITSAGSLPNRHVVHAAAMGYRAENEAIPNEAGDRSIAFPRDDPGTRIELVRFVVRCDDDRAVFERAVG